MGLFQPNLEEKAFGREYWNEKLQLFAKGR